MNATSHSPFAFTLGASRRDEFACWVAGLAFTFTLFFALAHIERVGQPNPALEIEDMPVVSLPFEPPPPDLKPHEVAPPTEDVTPLTGIEVQSSDSAVRIAVVPPDLEALVTQSQVPPSAHVSLSRLQTEFKPRVDVQFDVNHVYQQAEVDQRPRAIVRVTPPVPNDVFGNKSTLAVRLLLVINPNGRAESARIVKTSGVAAFDEIVTETVMNDWVFSPAIKKGRKVRCLAEQSFRVNLSGGTSPFNTE